MGPHEEHPGLAGRVRQHDLLAMAVEVSPDPPEDVPGEADGPLVLRHAGAIATVILNRPARRNALSLDLIGRLRVVPSAHSLAGSIERGVVLRWPGPPAVTGWGWC